MSGRDCRRSEPQSHGAVSSILSNIQAGTGSLANPGTLTSFSFIVYMVLTMEGSWTCSLSMEAASSQ